MYGSKTQGAGLTKRVRSNWLGDDTAGGTKLTQWQEDANEKMDQSEREPAQVVRKPGDTTHQQ